MSTARSRLPPEAMREWGRRPADERAAALVAAAGVLRRRRPQLAALQVRECAKPWPEADADVCEAIDFLEYYARQALELEQGRTLLQAPGERNTMRYAPRGVCAVIAPWNFPLAIPTGMVAGALAGGNAVILKPAEQSPASGLACVEALREGGVPRRCGAPAARRAATWAPRSCGIRAWRRSPSRARGPSGSGSSSRPRARRPASAT